MPDMDYQGSDLCIGGFFDAMLAESLNIQNEVMHGVFQLNSERPYGTCFMSLHLLIRCALTQKNYKLAEKYTKVLGRSPRYAYEAKKILPYCYGESLPLPVSNTSGKALLVDKNPISLLLMLSYTDLASKRSRDRFIAYQLLDQRFNNE